MIGTLAAMAILFASGSAAADPAKLAILGPPSISAVVRGGANHHTATINVIVENTGETATAVTGEVLIDDSVNPGCHTIHVTPQINPSTVGAHAAIAVRVVIPVGLDCAGRSGTLLIKGTRGADAASARFTLSRRLRTTTISIPAFVSLAMTLVSLLALFFITKGAWFLTSGGLAVGPGWTLSGSWLTNVGALGGLLGGVLGATSFLSDLVPGLSTAPFVGLSLAYGGTVIGAPIVYYAFSRQQPDPSKPNTNATVTVGTGRGLTALMVITLFGIYGELASLSLLVYESNRPWFETAPLVAGIVTAAIAAGAYAVRSTHDTISYAINNNAPARLIGAAL